MKKAGIVTVAIILLATGVILFYRLQGNGDKVKEHSDKEQGTLVKEYIEWKKYYM